MISGNGTAISTGLLDKVIAVTGGTGSFGQVIAQRALDSGCAELRVFSRDELKQNAMRAQLNDDRARFFLGDVRDAPSLDAPFRGADLVFHAAALKQVPSCEFFPMQAVKTNVEGSVNVIERAQRQGVRSVVCLSTDKAVYPVNAMGMSKALMEKVVQAWARTIQHGDVVVSSVRYGNVMYSRGSVIPLFVERIREGRVIPVTEPHMTRFMMPLRDAVDLVEFALEYALPGDLFIRKSPACTIAVLVEALLRLFRSSCPLQVIGVRHGEKLFETLATKEELRRSDDLGDYLRVALDDRDLNYDKYYVEGDPEEAATDDYHSHNSRRLDVDELMALLATLPEIRREVAAMWGDEEAQTILEPLGEQCAPLG